MTLIEIMVVVMIIGMIASAVGVNVLGSVGEAREEQAQTDTANISAIAERYVATHPGASCPSVRDLEEQRLLTLPGGNDRDPWEHPYAIDCDDGEVHARSAGPNGVFDDGDDIL